MAEIKLSKLPDRTPVRLALVLNPELHRRLADYAIFYEEAYGQAASVADLVPAILDSFLNEDRNFQRRRKNGP